MALAAGTRLGPYEILAPIGAGGMGEVYRARDSKLNRDVAIKVLLAALADDADYLARFQREAQVLATLNHPNIAAIYGLEGKAIVMELVEGQTLAERIAAGPIPVDEALPIAKQIADALEAAHEKGIVHRDLKPGNVKITPEGLVKVLDFGLAKTSAPAPTAAAASSPTLTIRASEAGLIMGTAGYMSPEQAAGKPVDKRADIWSFGVVLWEMLTGKRLFDGETTSHTLANVLTAPADCSRLPAPTPAAIRDLLRRCLDRDVKNRLRDIGEARVVIQKYLTNPVDTRETTSTAPSRRWLRIGASITTSVLLVALGSLAFVHFREPQPPASEVVRFRFAPPERATLGQNLVVSPNGKWVAFLAIGEDGVNRLWVHSLNSLDSRPLAGTEGVYLPGYPFWSWDSRFVVFQVGAYGVSGKLKKVDVSGGPAQTLCEIPGTLLGGFWTRQGKIVFGANDSGLLEVASGGGAPSALTTLDPAGQERDHAFPIILPDGRHFLYARESLSAEKAGIYVGSLDAKPGSQGGKRLLPDPSAHFYVPAPETGATPDKGYLLFVRENALMVQPFDAGRAELTGDAIPVVQEIASVGAFGVSANGVLAYRTEGRENRQLTWFDRQGKVLGTAGPPGLQLPSSCAGWNPRGRSEPREITRRRYLDYRVRPQRLHHAIHLRPR